MPAVTLIFLFLMAVMLVTMIQIHFLEIAFSKLGLTPETTFMVLLGTLLGSAINIPVAKVPTEESGHWVQEPGSRPYWEILQPATPGHTVIAVNLGGCLIPLGLSVYFISLGVLDPVRLAIALAGITVLSYRLSRPVPGLGIAMPLFVAPVTAALLSLALDPDHAAHMAYVSGVLGVLIGADILHLPSIGRMGIKVASIGGAGTFDGIFLTGIIAALLA